MPVEIRCGFSSFARPDRKLVRAAALVVALAAPLAAQELSDATEEFVNLRTERAKFYATAEAGKYLALYVSAPIHELVDGQWVDIAREEGEMEPQPAGKVLSTWWGAWAGNGGCVVRNTDDTYQWTNNDRHIGLFSDGKMYRTILSFWTPVPSGAAVQRYIRVFVYRDSDFLCGSQVRLLSGGVPGDAEQMFEWIGSGELVLVDENIDSEWPWTETSQAQKIAAKIQAGSVHFGLTPPLAWQEGVRPAGWGELKDGAK